MALPGLLDHGVETAGTGGEQFDRGDFFAARELAAEAGLGAHGGGWEVGGGRRVAEDLGLTRGFGQRVDRLGDVVDVGRGAAAAAAHSGDAQLDEALGVLGEVFRRGEIEHAPLHLLGLPSIGHGDERLGGETDAALDGVKELGWAYAAVESNAIHGGRGIQLAHDLFDGGSAAGFALGIDDDGDDDRQRCDAAGGLGGEEGVVQVWKGLQHDEVDALGIE